jgi:hypothetical protein
VNFRSAFILFSIWASAVAQADTCRDSAALLGSDPGRQRESLREEVIEQLASLFGLAINDKAPMEAAHERIQELADREGKAFAEILREVEAREVSPTEKREGAEELRAIRAEEQSRLHEGLRPYLDPIGRDHRKVIEETLIRPGLVYPLVTGEVEFRFRGVHRIAVGDERWWGGREGETKKVSFGPRDSFAIGQVPVTQLLYFLAALGAKKVDATPSEFKEGAGAVVLRLGDKVYALKPNHPVENVSYVEARAHAARVSGLTGLSYRLPTQLKWEFANRAGSTSRYHFGDDATELSRYAWFKENAGDQTHAVGQLLPNAFHLYDTHGNVWEWTSSRNGLERVVRGGAWYLDARTLRSANCSIRAPEARYGSTLGFRLERQSVGIARPAHTFTLGEQEAKPGTVSWDALHSFYQGLLDRLRRLGK